MLKFKRPWVIAELGINWQGDRQRILQMCNVCSAAGIDAVKFQTRTITEDVPRHTWETPKICPWDTSLTLPYIEYKRIMELTQDDYKMIDDHCRKIGLKWSTSVWGETAMDFMSVWDLPFIKIPSCKLTNEGLLRKAARYCRDKKCDLIISTGLSTQEEVDEAYGQIKDECPSLIPNQLVIMNCNGSYPSKTSELNLSLIHDWEKRYEGCRIGLSTHSMTLGTTVAAAYLNYKVIEFHLTFDRNAPGTDHAASVTYHGAFKLMSGLRDLEEAYGNGKKELMESELPFRKKLRG